MPHSLPDGSVEVLVDECKPLNWQGCGNGATHFLLTALTWQNFQLPFNIKYLPTFSGYMQRMDAWLPLQQIESNTVCTQ